MEGLHVRELHQENYTSLVELTSLEISLESVCHLGVQPSNSSAIQVTLSGDSCHSSLAQVTKS
jgi:hypothetical protein